MAEKTVLGTPGMIYQGLTRSWSRSTGWTNTLRWTGEKKFGTGLQLQLIDAGYESTYTEDGPNCIVEGSRAGEENQGAGLEEKPVDRWERKVNRIEKSIYEHYNLVNELKTEKAIGLLKKQVESGEPFDTSEVPAGTDGVKMEAWFDFIRAGVDSFVVFQPVVTLVQTVSDRYDKAKFAKTNVGKILSYQQMIDLESAPLFVLDEKPSFDADIKLKVIPGYFKNDPQFTPAANNKWEVTTEWELGYWAEKIYQKVA